MPLSHYYIMHYNKTWYEQKFSAVPTYDKEDYKKDIKMWKDAKSSKPDMSAYFTAVQNTKRRVFLEDMYKKSTSLADFLKQTKGIDCLLYKDWSDLLMRKHFNNLNGMSWSIDASLLKIT